MTFFVMIPERPSLKEKLDNQVSKTGDKWEWTQRSVIGGNVFEN